MTSQISIALGTSYAYGPVTITSVSDPATVRGLLLDASGNASITDVPQGGVYLFTVAKSTGASILTAAVTVTGVPQDITATLNNTAAATGSLVQSASVTLSAAQVKALDATAITVVPAPGAGKVIVPVQVFMQYKFLTTAFTVGVGSTLGIIWHGADIATQYTQFISQEGFLDQTASQVSTPAWGSGLGTPQTTAANASLDVKSSAAISVGLGSLVVTVYYQTLTLS